MRISTFGYSMKQGVKNIGRNKMFSMASIATMSACIFLFGLFYSIVMNFNYIVDKAEPVSYTHLSLYQGLQLQLMVYIKAAVEREKKRHPGKEIVPSGVFYYRIQDPLLDGKVMDEVLRGTEEEKKEQMEKEMLKALRPDGLVNLSGENLKHLQKIPVSYTHRDVYKRQG